TTQEGLHVFVASTTGPITHKSDYVNAQVFRSVIGLQEAKDYINFGAGGDEDILRQIMMAATELAEGIVGTCVQRLYTNVRIPGSTKIAIRLPHAPVPTSASVVSITSILTGGPSWVTSDLTVDPASGVVTLAAQVPFWLGPWQATYMAGRTVIPQSVQLAVKEIIYDMWSTQRPYGGGEMEPGPEATARFEQMVASYTI